VLLHLLRRPARPALLHLRLLLRRLALLRLRGVSD